MAVALRVTRRCLREDLGLSAAEVVAPIEDIAETCPIVRAFLERRSQNPQGQETIQGLTSRIVAYSLHGGRERGITWHDEQEDVVWLMASHLHAAGDADDAYPYFLDLDRQGKLLPTRDDYADLIIQSQAPTFAESVLRDAPPLVAAAQESPGTIQAGTVAGRIRVRCVYEDGELPMMTVAISQRLLPGEVQVPPEWQFILAAAFLPGTTQPSDLSLAFDLAGEEKEEDEVAYCNFVEEL